MPYSILYKTTNIVNGNIYVGIHKCKKLNDGYIGNGVYTSLDGQTLRRDYSSRKGIPFVAAVLKHGCENFKREIIAILESYKAAAELEKFIVNEDFVQRSDTYNVRVGGIKGFIDNISDKERQRRSNWMKQLNSRGKHKEWRDNIGKAQKGRIQKPSAIEKMRKSLTKYDYTEVAQQIKHLLNDGFSESQITEMTGYSKGCIYRAKKKIKQNAV